MIPDEDRDAHGVNVGGGGDVDVASIALSQCCLAGVVMTSLRESFAPFHAGDDDVVAATMTACLLVPDDDLKS